MTDIEGPSPDSVGAGAPETEIEVTPEMIGAGLGEISGFDLEDARDGFLDRGELVSRIFRAMLLARRESGKVGCE
jgi:hypothetical protein